MQVRKAFVSLVTVLALAAIFAFQTGAVSFGGGDGSYAFMRHRPGDPGTPVTFSSCKPIRVEINLDGVDDPETAQRIILGAMGELSAASGLHLQYVGPTTRRPRWPDHTLTIEGGAWPVLVAFANPDEVPGLKGGVIGLGGPTTIQRGGVEMHVTGEVALETDWFNQLPDRPRAQERGRAVVMHELGHVLGLGHVEDDHEVMAAHGGATELGPGDRKGLALLGKGPCI